jgi:hypothetical protein
VIAICLNLGASEELGVDHEHAAGADGEVVDVATGRARDCVQDVPSVPFQRLQEIPRDGLTSRANVPRSAAEGRARLDNSPPGHRLTRFVQG